MVTLIWRRIEWAMHNILGHPIMELCFIFGLERLGLWIHDETLPAEDEDYVPICNQYVIDGDTADAIMAKLDKEYGDKDEEDKED